MRAITLPAYLEMKDGTYCEVAAVMASPDLQKQCVKDNLWRQVRRHLRRTEADEIKLTPIRDNVVPLRDRTLSSPPAGLSCLRAGQ